MNFLFFPLSGSAPSLPHLDVLIVAIQVRYRADKVDQIAKLFRSLARVELEDGELAQKVLVLQLKVIMIRSRIASDQGLQVAELHDSRLGFFSDFRFLSHPGHEWGYCTP